MVSKVLGADGLIHPRSAPWPPLLDREVVIAAARRRLVSLRLARWGSLLVHRDVVAEHGPPRADYAGGADDLEWTSRILRTRHGYLVPGSVAARSEHDSKLPLREVRDRVRMVGGKGWVAQEPLWFAFLLGVDLIRAGRGLTARRAGGEDRRADRAEPPGGAPDRSY